MSDPQLVTREQWDARAPDCRTSLVDSHGFAVHWAGSATGLHADIDHGRCVAEIQGQQRFHMDTRGWCDIAYNFLTCPHVIFEGRGWGIRSAAQGTTFGNDHYHAVQVMIGQGDDPLTVFQLRAVLWLRDQHEQRYGRTGLRPHSSFKATACPGPDLQQWLQDGAPIPEDDMFGSVIGLQRGDQGERVQYLQYVLNQILRVQDAELITTDGVFGVKTQATIAMVTELDSASPVSAEHAARLTLRYVRHVGRPGPPGPAGEFPDQITVSGTLNVESA